MQLVYSSTVVIPVTTIALSTRPWPKTYNIRKTLSSPCIDHKLAIIKRAVSTIIDVSWLKQVSHVHHLCRDLRLVELALVDNYIQTEVQVSRMPRLYLLG
jgi:hypothetical protein